VEQFDHHCGMIGACIGRRNIGSFLRFLVCAWLDALWGVGFGVYCALSAHRNETSDTNSSLCLGIGVGVTVIGAPVLFMLTIFLSFYIRLIAKNLTNREFQKADALYPEGNPFDNGCTRNTVDWCCAIRSVDFHDPTVAPHVM